MELSLRRWRPGHLLASWAAYWVGLAGVNLGPSIKAAWRATRLPEGHGSIGAVFDNGILTLTVVEEGVRTLVSSAPVGTAIAWIVGPPLALWLVWLGIRSREVSSREAALGRAEAEQLAAGAPPAEEWRVRRDDVHVERERIRTPNP